MTKHRYIETIILTVVLAALVALVLARSAGASPVRKPPPGCFKQLRGPEIPCPAGPPPPCTDPRCK